jgi:transcriptional regulator with XRE-family HTH domain
MTQTSGSRLRDLGAFIRQQRKNAQLSLRNLAAQAGVSNPYLSQIERGLRNPSAEILQAIARALRISAETLYVKAGFLEERERDIEAAILADPSITERQRIALIEVYRSFQREAARERGERSGAPEPPGE